MNGCDEIRKFYEENHGPANIQKIYDTIIDWLKAEIQTGGCEEGCFTVYYEEIVAVVGNWLKFKQILPNLRKKFEDEGFGFDYHEAIDALDVTGITLSGWVEEKE